jgi:hypothetical protein
MSMHLLFKAIFPINKKKAFCDVTAITGKTRTMEIKFYPIEVLSMLQFCLIGPGLLGYKGSHWL